MFTRHLSKLTVALGFLMCLSGCDWATVASVANRLLLNPGSSIGEMGGSSLGGLFNPGIPTNLPGVPTNLPGAPTNLPGVPATPSAGQFIPGGVPSGLNLPGGVGQFGTGGVPSFAPNGAPIVRITAGGGGGSIVVITSTTPRTPIIGSPLNFGTPFRGSNAQSFLQPTAPSAVGMPF